MKRTLRAAAWLILIGMIALGPFWAASIGVRRQNKVVSHYASWTGVLRLWKYEGWQSGNGSLSHWLNACIERFEKKHPGVYVQVTDVSEEAMKEFIISSVSPPDLILYPPGLLEAPYHLMEMDEGFPLRASVDGTGFWQGRRYAVPVALGGYALAINTRLLPETPAKWSETAAAQDVILLDAPSDGGYVSWSAAMLALFAGSSTAASDDEPPPVGEGIDLGLPDTQTEPEPTQAQAEAESVNNDLPAVLPETFRQEASVYTRFTKGEIAAMPVTQRELRRLQQLSETGKAPDWRAEAIGLPFTDQAALVSVAACGREDSEERQGLCMELIHLMLSAEMQSKLTTSRAFPVIELPPLYGNQAGMREIEKAISGDELLTPPAFGEEWREYADRLMDEIDAGEGTQGAYERLGEMMMGEE